MQQFNKATAAAISAAVTGLLLAFVPTLDPAVVSAVGTLVTAALVWAVPNKGAAT